MGRLIALCVAAMAVAGCCNINVRSQGTTEYYGRKKGTPYCIAKYPYYCTAAVWRDAVCAPFRAFSNNSGPDGIADAIFTITWPFWVVDEVCEVALDTVFLPVDATYQICK